LGAISSGLNASTAYADAARARIDAVEPVPDAAQADASGQARAAARAVQALLEAGYIMPGEQLVDGASVMPRWCAPMARWPAGDHEGSIHKVGALVERARPAMAGPSGMQARRRAGLHRRLPHEIRKTAV
jgi:modification methylase